MNDASVSREIEFAANGNVATGNVVTPDFTPWLDSGNRAMRGWIETNSAMLRSSLGIAGQMAEFSQSRLKTDLDLWKTLSGCGSMSEFFACQMKYVEQATSDYLGEVKELADRVLGVVDAAARQLQEPATKL